MKNLNKRTKMLLAITGLVVIVVVAGIVFLVPGGTGLFGTTALAITPSNSSIAIGATQGLSVNAFYNCNWFTSNAAIVSITTDATEVKTVTVKGTAAGTATIEARCGLANLNHVSTSVTVNTPPPPAAPPVITIGPDTGKTTPDIGLNERLTLCTGDSSVQWTVTTVGPLPSSHVVDLTGSRYGPGCALVTGVDSGTAEVRATNAGGGSAAVTVLVDALLTMTPAYPTIAVGESIEMTMTSAIVSTKWSIARGCEDVPADACHVRLSSNMGKSVTITGHAAGCAVITAIDPYPPGGLTMVCVP